MTNDLAPEQPVQAGPEKPVVKPVETKPPEQPLGSKEEGIIDRIDQDGNPDNILGDIASGDTPPKGNLETLRDRLANGQEIHVGSQSDREPTINQEPTSRGVKNAVIDMVQGSDGKWTTKDPKTPNSSQFSELPHNISEQNNPPSPNIESDLPTTGTSTPRFGERPPQFNSPQENDPRHPDTQAELRPTPETYEAVQRLVTEVQGIIREAHGLQGISNASERIWNGSDAELSALIRQDLLQDAGTYSIVSEGEDLGSVIHFPPQMMDRLANSDIQSLLKGESLPDLLALIEETSHYTYQESYREKFPSQKPHSANTEMMGVIDKYNVLQALYIKNFGRTMDSSENAEAIYHAAVAYEESNWNGDRPAQYIIGHELGRQYVDFLNTLHSDGVDVSPELTAFYGADNRAQIEHLLYDLGLEIKTRTVAESEDVGRVFQEIGVRVQNAPIPNQTQ